VSALAVHGTTSWAGKSLVATALCRWFVRRGVLVAPFKAANMSNNARVVDGGEIGSAQYLQALAAGVTPDVRMNPVLVKPEADTKSQVVLLGQADPELSALPWRRRAERQWAVAQDALRALLSEYELVVLEGAGSPAEINLRSTDLANMRAAGVADARVLLVTDIDRGGAFAHLYGTWHLLAAPERRRIGGFLLNKFRGDPALLDPAPAVLERKTGVPTVGVLPWLEHGLPDEDGAHEPRVSGGRARVAVVRYPTASNLDEFRTLEQVADVVWAREPRDLDDADLVVLPGSKHVAADRAWLRDRRFDEPLRARAAAGSRILGICGGLQILGERFDDRAGVDGNGHGLGLLPLRTVFRGEKRTRRTTAAFAELDAPWTGLTHATLVGYEIRHGTTEPTAQVEAALPDGLGYAAGPILAVYVHGLFEQPELVRRLIGSSSTESLDDVFEALADALDAHVRMDAVSALAGVP
jgi:adenosylcobyric acid synthase